MRLKEKFQEWLNKNHSAMQNSVFIGQFFIKNMNFFAFDVSLYYLR